MKEFEAFVKKFRSLPQAINKSFKESLNESSELIAKMQREQFYEGKTANNKRITPEYSPITKQIKKAENQISEHVTLFDEGKFAYGIYDEVISVQQFDDLFVATIDIFSTDWKAEQLTKKYSEDNPLWGLTENNEIRLMNREIFPQIEKDIIKHLTT